MRASGSLALSPHELAPRLDRAADGLLDLHPAFLHDLEVIDRPRVPRRALQLFQALLQRVLRFEIVPLQRHPKHRARLRVGAGERRGQLGLLDEVRDPRAVV